MRRSSLPGHHGGPVHKNSGLAIGQVISRMFTFTAAVFVLCVLGILINLWITDHYVDHTYAKKIATDSNISNINVENKDRPLNLRYKVNLKIE